MRKEQYFTNALRIILTLFLLTFFATPVYPADENQSGDPFARFGNSSEGSDLAINHSIWSSVLEATIFVIRPTSHRMASIRNQPRTGTKVSRGSNSPARFESNRVVFHMLQEEHLDLVRKYRGELERLPDLYPLAEFKKDEQLAYWLNLHNAVLFEQLAEHYPISKLKSLRLGKSKRPALWDEKLVTVEGVALSLNDIQNKILIRHWASPMVLYGLYQGAIGGPSLPIKAFTGENVHNLLKSTAREFVNSNRGFRMRGNKAQVSLTYKWGSAAFPNWERDVARHLVKFADSSHRAELAGANEFVAKLYDWVIADLTGGTLSVGPIQSTAAGLGTKSRFLQSLRQESLAKREALDPATARLLRGVAEAQRFGGLPEGEVTSIECGTGPCPEDGPDIEPEPENEVLGLEDEGKE
ncbi:MAG: DUF547 domain-containing protein [Sphingomonadales bacterium]